MRIRIGDYDALLKPAKLWQRNEIVSDAVTLPKVGGIYAWYFQGIPSGVPITDCIKGEGLTLLYIGIAPRASSSKDNLHKRIRYHYMGNAYGSTLRLSLGCLLGKELGIQLRRVSERRMTFAQGEEKLSEWLAANAFVVWMTTAEPWTVEKDLIQSVSLPLNLEHNEKHPFYSALSGMRAAARKIARELPVV